MLLPCPESQSNAMQAISCLSITPILLHGVYKSNACSLGSKNASWPQIFSFQTSSRSDTYTEVYKDDHSFSTKEPRFRINRVFAGSMNPGGPDPAGRDQGQNASEEKDGAVNNGGSSDDGANARALIESPTSSGTTNKVSLAIRKPLLGTVQQEENEDTKDSLGETTSDDDTSLEFSTSDFSQRVSVFLPTPLPIKPNPRLSINLDLELYRAKRLARKERYDDAEQILRQCIKDWPNDGRPYMILGRLLSKRGKFVKARSVFENGCQATQGENAFIWQGWAVLEHKMGNVAKARKLFDAATVADKRHAAAWHGWAFLEINQGNVKKARDLLGKGLEYCAPNEYLFQTLALLEVKAKRYDQARSLFLQATKCNPRSCASWLSWAQLEAEQDNNIIARYLFERSVQASPKNRFAWQIWALFEASQGDNDKARKLFKIGHALNPKDPVLLQSLALLEYKCSSANIARELFKQASQVDPTHQPTWIAWGWMEWKEGNIAAARELYQMAIKIDSRSADAARCLQAWGVLEEREGNVAIARRLFRSSLNIDSQNFVTWMSWATLEENQGNSVRAEEIRNLYFQQRTEVVGDASWDMNLSNIFAPAISSIMGFLNFNQDHSLSRNEGPQKASLPQSSGDNLAETGVFPGLEHMPDIVPTNAYRINGRFDIDSFLREKLSFDVSKAYVGVGPFFWKKNEDSNRVWKPLKRMDET